MTRNPLTAVMAIAIVNGIFSPLVLFVFLLYPVWLPEWAPPLVQLVYMLSALILATLTIMISGVPAALYERLAGNPDERVSGAIWIVAAVLLVLPAVPNVLRALGLG